ncbi:MAG TPA: GntR family transcriptional regulator [Anaerolineae bacterium]|nr:GntR family transcriptional regulator [Anaerolineae bacterium]HOQ97258.1 GntR family transcriptional regulator [Anaerolineae bacterium]HPL27660.1 GntR family transcriptional regulator [Anaerolineae bacterium]
MQLDPAKPAALTDWAYSTIKQAILSLEFAPGAQLPIDDLAERLGISRTPVREALLRLEADGLVHTVPRVGFFVAEITRRDLLELFEIRELLESHATKQAAARLSDGDLAYIDGLLQDSAEAVERGDLARFQEVEITFHNLFVERAQNRRLLAIMASIRDLTYRQRVLSLASLENVRQSLVEHQRIAQALRQRDAELAGRRMAEHVAAARDRLLEFVVLPE